MNIKTTLVLCLSLLTACSENEEVVVEATTSVRNPNIVILYVDDLGYGDIGVNGALAVVTPNIDQLAAEGINFTDAHSTAATCTPSRYALLTGEHGFRIESDILEGNAPALIKPGRQTLPSMLKRANYRTAVIGKWHLGLGDGEVNWNEAVKPGPLEIGFDYSFLLPSTGDRVPTVYLENHHVVNLDQEDPIKISYSGKIGDRPTGMERPDLLRYPADPQHSETIINGVSRIGSIAGGEKALWKDEEFPYLFTDKAREFMSDKSEKPFFLFYSFHDIHVPRLPHPDFMGTTDMGPRGDAIAQVDWVVGQIVDELSALGIAENTIILFTSDNGPVLDDGYGDGAVEKLGNHRPASIYRGGKYSAYEGGTRMPTIINWPGTINSGVSDALLSQVDLYASIASIVGIELRDDEAQDSLDLSEAFLGQTSQARHYIIEESAATLSLRMGSWKYIVPTTEDKRARAAWVADDKDIEGGFVPEAQLYDLSIDIGERNNVAQEYPEIASQMKNKIEELRLSGFRK